MFPLALSRARLSAAVPAAALAATLLLAGCDESSRTPAPRSAAVPEAATAQVTFTAVAPPHSGAVMPVGSAPQVLPWEATAPADALASGESIDALDSAASLPAVTAGSCLSTAPASAAPRLDPVPEPAPPVGLAVGALGVALAIGRRRRGRSPCPTRSH